MPGQMIAPKRVTFEQAPVRGDSLEFFVVTGSIEDPIACCADNSGFPRVHDFYARAETRQDLKGIHVTVRFDEPAQGQAFAVNIWQPSMTGPYTVIPV